MKILAYDRISSLSLSSGASALGAYSISKVQNNVPSNPFILATGSLDGNDYQTVTVTVSTSGTVDGMFISGIAADSATYSVDSGSDVNLNYSYHTSYGEWVSQNIALTRPEYVDLTSASSPSIAITLKSSTDQKDSPISGNAIASWTLDNPSAESGSSASGRFYDSSGTVVNVVEHGRVFIGSYVKGTYDSAATIAQVTKIKGTGTATFGIELSTPLDTGSITYIRNPVKIGCLKVGQSLDLPNPQAPLSRNDVDFSQRFDLFGGAYTNRLHPKTRVFDCNFLTTRSEGDTMMEYFDAIRSAPFAIRLLDMDDTLSETTELSMLAHLQDAPQFSYQNKTGSLVEISASFREIQ